MLGKRVKKIAKVTIIVLIIIDLIFITNYVTKLPKTIVKQDNTIQTKYVMNGYMKDNNKVVTEDGNEWIYDTNIKTGQRVKVTFYDNKTKNIYDDIIIDIKEY